MADRKTSKPPRSATDYSIIFQKVSQTIAQNAGDPFYANISRAGIGFALSSQLHYSQDAVRNEIKEELLREFFRHAKSFGGYDLDTIPLSMRHILKERLYADMENDRTGTGNLIIQKLLDMDQKERKKVRRTVSSLFTLNDFTEKAGLIRYLGVSPQQQAQRIEFKPSNPDVMRLIRFRDEDYLVPMVTGLPGAGKSNTAIKVTRLTVDFNYGYLNPSYGMGQTKVSVYFPRYQWEKGTAFSYRHVWDIFKETKKGSSILWKKYQHTMYSEEMGSNADDVFAVLYLGEVGAGKLVFSTSATTMAYKEFFSQIRQLRIRPLLSSAQPISKELMIEFINPQIVMEADPETGARRAEAQYIDTSGENVTKVNLGKVDLDPLTVRIGKGIAADFSEDLETFRIKTMYAKTDVTDIKKYLKDPDTVIQDASDWVYRWEEANGFTDDYKDEPDEERTREEIRKTQKKPQQDKEGRAATNDKYIIDPD